MLVLEARDRVGGRVLSHTLQDGSYSELGGMFTGPTQDHIQALAKDVGVGLLPDVQHGQQRLRRRRRQARGVPERHPARHGPADPVVAPDIVLAVAQLDQMATELPVDAPWTSPHAEEWDRQTLDTWLRGHTSGSDEFMAVTSAATEAIFGCEPRELSLLFTVFYLAASGNEQNQGTFERNFNTEGRRPGDSASPEARTDPAAGCRAAREPRAPECAGAADRADAPPGVTVDSDSFVVNGQRVIVAIPPVLASRIVYEPALPPLRDQLTQHMPQGSLMKFEAVYPTPFWRGKG